MTKVMISHSFSISDEEHMVLFGQSLKDAAQSAGFPGSIIYLKGDLGMGKTTLIRGFIQALGHNGAVKSPTYTLVEPYNLDNVEVNHFDLYRLNSPIECEEMGIRDYMGSHAYCLIEWPEKGEGILPEPDLLIEIVPAQFGRQVVCKAFAPKGQTLLNKLMEKYG